MLRLKDEHNIMIFKGRPISLLYWGDRMGRMGGVRIVIVYVNIYAIL